MSLFYKTTLSRCHNFVEKTEPMKQILILFSVCSFLSLACSINAQVKLPDVKPEMKKLNWLIGKWKGQGWMMLPNGQRESFDQIEVVQWKLDSTIIQIEGQGIADEKIVHNALAILSFNAEKQEFSFSSYLSDGRQGLYKAEVLDTTSMRWWLETPRGKIRYTIKLEEDQWLETGEFEMRPDNWFQIFEMKLERAD